MAKPLATVIFDRCRPAECSADGRCPARSACEKRVLKQDAPGEPPYVFAMCVGCGDCVEACPLDAIELR